MEAWDRGLRGGEQGGHSKTGKRIRQIGHTHYGGLARVMGIKDRVEKSGGDLSNNENYRRHFKDKRAGGQIAIKKRINQRSKTKSRGRRETIVAGWTSGDYLTIGRLAKKRRWRRGGSSTQKNGEAEKSEQHGGLAKPRFHAGTTCAQ